MYRTMYLKESKTMTITEFCKSRNVDAQAIRKYIERHPVDFTGHTGKKGRAITLDNYAIKILEEKYPLPSPVEIIEDKETRLKLIQAQERIIQLQNKLQEQTTVIAQAESIKLLLQDRDQQIQELKTQLQAERSKTWWDKLRGK